MKGGRIAKHFSLQIVGYVLKFDVLTRHAQSGTFAVTVEAVSSNGSEVARGTAVSDSVGSNLSRNQ